MICLLNVGLSPECLVLVIISAEVMTALFPRSGGEEIISRRFQEFRLILSI